MNNELVLIENKIYEIRNTKVMLDFDLAELYGIETKRLKEQVKRNIERFPIDFMFELTKTEWKEVVANCDHLPTNMKYSPFLPFAFTENGVAMLSSVLHSPLAIQVNINIMRAFTKMRQFVLSQKDCNLSVREELEGIKEQLAEIAEDLESNERDHETLFKAIAEISLKLQLNKSNPGRITVKGFQNKEEQ
ncbi:MAG: ORF6N domain-containing protein [Bacteroides sp.]|nr:ORF6N domain-containing protein [Bacteroides sp.]